MEKFSLSDIKKMNYSDVYHFIYNNSNCSKQLIANTLRMSLPTVSQHLNDLISQGLIEKCGRLESQVGRKATAYAIVPDAVAAIGVEIVKENALIVALDLYGNTIGHAHVMEPFRNEPGYFQKITDTVLSFIASLSLKHSQILGVSFAFQGLVSEDGVRLTYCKVLGCTGLTVEEFQKYLPFPCRLIHDSECAANSDLWNNPEITDAIYLSVNHYLGGALIMDGKVHNGRTGKSGTFEHMTLIPGGLPCYCGNQGCMSCYCSVSALTGDGDDLDTFFEAKNQKDPGALKRWDTFVDHLAMAINNLHLVMDCEIILGGHASAYLTKEDMDEIYRRIQAHAAFPEERSYLIQGHLRKHGVAVGAALPYIIEFLANV